MTSKFAAGFLNGLKEGPGLFFAPLVGAIKGIRAETGRVTQTRGDAQATREQEKNRNCH